MDAIFENFRTIEALKQEWASAHISIKPCLRCKVNKITGEKLPGEYEYLKHTSGTQKFFAVSDDQKNFCSVAEALAKDLEATGAPDPTKVVVVSDISQDEGKTFVTTLHYQGGGTKATFVF